MERYNRVKSVKSEREHLQRAALRRQKKDLESRAKATETIRLQQELHRERRHMASSLMEEKMRKRLEEKHAAEELKLRAEEARLAALEQRELELLRSLQARQEEERRELERMEQPPQQSSSFAAHHISDRRVPTAKSA